MRPPCGGRIWVSQGGLSRNKVAVGESAAGSPPNERDQVHHLAHSPMVVFRTAAIAGRALTNCRG